VNTRGLFLAFEGGERCGKSTQAALAAGSLGALLTREPGGTAVGERIRSIILDPDLGELGAEAELLLMAAARAEHVRTVIEPTLDSGRHVVTDRFSGSSVAYQGYGRGIDLEQVRAISRFATGGVEPDLTLLLEVPAEVVAARAAGTPDRIEALDAGFHERVREGFGDLARSEPERWVVVDGVGTPPEVATRVLAALRRRLPALAEAAR
jgi:dTMP kinase